MRKDITLEPGDVWIIRQFVKANIGGYVDEWTDQECVDEMTNWIYENTHTEGSK